MATSKDLAAPATNRITTWTTSRIISWATRRRGRGLTPLLIFLLSFIARASIIGRYVTPDEPIWVYRALGLRQALLSADWPNTIQSGHPGVTTTWLGALAGQLNLWLYPQTREHLNWLDRLYWLTPDNGAAMQRLASFLTTSRLTVILVSSLGIVAIYLLARNRIGPRAALVTATLLAFDPFIAGLGSLLHVDGLLALFMIVAILLIMPTRASWSDESKDDWKTAGRGQLILAGISTGLAILTKSPGLFLVSMVPIIYLWPFFRPFLWPNGPFAKRLVSLLHWAAAAVMTALILLPALWAAPGKVLDITNELASRLIESSIRPSFFLGQVTLEPGPAFYPIAVAFRLSPLVSIGLISLLIWVVCRFARRRSLHIPANIIWLILYSLSFILFLNLSAKRFDRYALPSIVALTLVAGWALTFFYERYVSGNKLKWATKIVFLLTLIGYFVTYWPYPLTAYNPLLGGPRLAEKVLPIGWGEGASDGARWASGLEDAADRTLYTGNVPSAAPFFPGSVKHLSDEALSFVQPEDLLMFVDQNWQSDPDLFTFSAQSSTPTYNPLDDQSPVYSSSFNGLSRAVVYSGLSAGDMAVKPLSTSPLSLTFDYRLDLLEVAVRPATWPDKLALTIAWVTRQAADFQLQLELVDMSGYSWVVRELPLLNDVDHASRFWPLNESQAVTYDLSLLPDLPPGGYELRARLFDDQGVGLGVFDGSGDFRGSSAVLATVSVASPASQPQLTIPNPLDGNFELSGYVDPPATAESGRPLILDIWWQPEPSSPVEAQLQLNVGATPLFSTMNNELMVPGITYHLRPDWLIPAELPGGAYPLSLRLLDMDDQPLWNAPISLGFIDIESPDRLYDLPLGIEPLKVKLGEVAYLQHGTVSLAGDVIEVPVIWQSLGSGHANYSVFVHLKDMENNIVDQDDRLPIVTTDSWATNQVIQDQHTLTMPKPGQYEVAIGLYDPQTGVRLPMVSAEGVPLPGDQYLIGISVP